MKLPDKDQIKRHLNRSSKRQVNAQQFNSEQKEALLKTNQFVSKEQDNVEDYKGYLSLVEKQAEYKEFSTFKMGVVLCKIIAELWQAGVVSQNPFVLPQSGQELPEHLEALVNAANIAQVQINNRVNQDAEAMIKGKKTITYSGTQVFTEGLIDGALLPTMARLADSKFGEALSGEKITIPEDSMGRIAALQTELINAINSSASPQKPSNRSR